MAVQIRGITTPTVDSGDATVSNTKPTGTTTGDLVLAAVHIISNAVSLAQPTIRGWYEVPRGSQSGDDSVAVWYRYAVSSEPSSYDFVANGSVIGLLGLITLYSDTSAELVIDDSNSQLNASSGDRTFPSLTATAAGVLACFGSLVSNLSSTPPGDMSEQWDTTGSGSRFYAMTKLTSGAGATGTKVATGSASISRCVSVHVVEGTPNTQWPRFAGNAEVTPTTRSSITIPFWSNTAEGDLVVAQLAMNITLGLSTPTDWSEVYVSDVANGIALYSKVMTAADISTGSVTITWSAGSQIVSGQTMTFISPNNKNLAIETEAHQTVTGAGSSISWLAVSPTYDYSLLVCVASRNNTSGTSNAQGGQFWERVDFGSSSVRIITFTELLFATGSTGTRSAASGSQQATTVSFTIYEYEDVTPDPYPVKVLGHATITFNGNSLTAYLSNFGLAAKVTEFDTSVHTAVGLKIPTLASWQLEIGGFWIKALDNILGAAVSQAQSKVDCVIVLGVSGHTVTYTWTANAFVSRYKVEPNPEFEIKFSSTIALSGAPTRT